MFCSPRMCYWQHWMLPEASVALGFQDTLKKSGLMELVTLQVQLQQYIDQFKAPRKKCMMETASWTNKTSTYLIIVSLRTTLVT